ncbi:putative ABC transporter [Podospora australis]|uniref:ABC transporter n=1 Tax=Podospora australis TaxID=1536484 RepID=A0AAN7AHA2_9PEZI|nr:putative ABC transporter [Podospora australis]
MTLMSIRKRAGNFYFQLKRDAQLFRKSPIQFNPYDPLQKNPPLFDLRTSAAIPDGLGILAQGRSGNLAVIGGSRSGKTTFLRMLQGELYCHPPDARKWPILEKEGLTPKKAMQYVGFDGEGIRNAITTSQYLSQRYESGRESTDFSLRDYLLGKTQVNVARLPGEKDVDQELFHQTVKNLDLRELLDLPVAYLSNGQTRRAKIAKALLNQPRVLLLDEPFVGLDPRTADKLNKTLAAVSSGPTKVVITARPEDELPDWLTQAVHLRSGSSHAIVRETTPSPPARKSKKAGHENTPAREEEPSSAGLDIKRPLGSQLPVVEMEHCQVRYGDKVALGSWEGGLTWRVNPGERWAVFGPNGSGKTTLVALLCSDHPQAYSLPMKIFGRSRLPGPAGGEKPITYWEVQRRIGHSSPEIHRHMPQHLTVRQVVESAWADTFISKPQLTREAVGWVEASLQWFEAELNPEWVWPTSKDHPPLSSDDDSMPPPLGWADQHTFGSLPFSSQRVLLFLRAVIKHPDIVVLDEAFSGMDERTRNKCFSFLDHGNKKDQGVLGMYAHQALICISHVKEEVPGCVREWMCLPEPNTGERARFGRFRRNWKVDDETWREIWGFGEEESKTTISMT